MPRNYKSEYENYHSKPKQKKRRAARNKARRAALRTGSVKKGDNLDVHHVDGNPRNNDARNLAVRSQHHNRSFKRTKSARKA